ncbi:LysR family transcriptional regulator [Rhodococcus pyridinivorans]|uniref:LysR family transcriptional regulator n=1 Tax=Rhodococcus pyridinivorans TaxID=103816 RepID=UPI00110DA7EA|nr:LysR family transcriptional regulator [Rhodococcus pyridinivorans]WMM72663.1 LysR family transcriptional regulator [Rhodococcus pyridinivorans]
MDLRRVDLNLLVVLEVLLSERNVTRAARRLNMSQPATSTALARLRKQFDDPLLVKSGRTLRPTVRAQAIVEPLREVLRTLERSVLAAPDFDPATDSRTFTIMTGDYAAITLLRLLVRGSTPAGIRFDLLPFNGAGLDAFRRFEIDLAVLPEHVLESPEFESCRRQVVLTDRLVGAVWSGHPYTGTKLTREVLGRYPLLSYAQYSDDTNLGRALLRAGAVAQVGATSGNLAVLPYALENTRMVTFLPERLARHLAEMAFLRILEPTFQLPPLREFAVWHAERDADPAHAWLRAQLDPIGRRRVAAQAG